MVRLLRDSLVLLEEGGRIRADSVSAGARVIAIQDAFGAGKIAYARARRFVLGDASPVTVVTLASGRQLRGVDETCLSTAAGNVPLSKLVSDTRVVLARHLPMPRKPEVWKEHELILLGHLIGDGSFLKGSPMRYTTSSEENSDAVRRSAEAMGCEVKRYAGRRTWHQLLISGNGNRWHPAGANRWLRELGIFGQRSHQKRLPDSLFALDNASLAMFLRHLWATDGTFSVDRRSQTRINYSTNSPGLASDVLSLLLRFGIVARCYVAAQGPYLPMHLIQVSGAHDQARFLHQIGFFGPKTPGALAVARTIEGVRSNTNVDTMPSEFFDRIEELVRGVPYLRDIRNGLRKKPQPSGGRLFSSRALLERCAKAVGDDLSMARATSDIFWDRVVAIAKEYAPQPTVELTLDPPGSGVLVDGILVGESSREYLAACPREETARVSTTRDREATAPRRNRRARRVARARA